MAIDFTSDLGMLRVLIPDCEQLTNPSRPGSEAEYIFSDAQLTAYLELNAGSIRRAAADACEVLGTSEAIIQKVITTQDLSTDGAKLMGQYLARAKQLRAQAKDEEELVVLDGVGMQIIPFYLEPSQLEPR